MKPNRSILCLLVLMPVALSAEQSAEPLPKCSSTSGDAECDNEYKYYQVADDFFHGAADLEFNTVGGGAFAPMLAAYQPFGFFTKITSGIKLVARKIKKGAIYAVKKVKGGAVGVVRVLRVGAREVRVFVQNITQPIFPGTRWCGAGNKAYNTTELGPCAKTDSCCMKHDNCKDNIIAGKEKHGLNNKGTYTRSHCDCDQAFYKCLKKVRSVVAKTIGYVYFNQLKPQCFRKELPVLDCLHTVIYPRSKRCLKYYYDMTATEKIWQWFDSWEF